MYRLCVIVPAKDEGVVIGDTLRSLIEAKVPPRDIYVIDDGSSDKTQEIAQSFGVNTLRNEVNVGKASSISRANEKFSLTSRYDFIALMDADTRVNKGYFKAVKRSFVKDQKVVLVCGQPKSRPYNWLTAYRCFGYSFMSFVYRGGQSAMGVISVAPGCATTYRSTIFGQLDWNSDTIVEDMDVTIQVHHKNLGKIVYQEDAIVHTQDPRNIRDYIKQMYRWDTGMWQVVKKYHMMTGIRKIDWEYKLLLGEGMLFALIYMLMPLWLLLFTKAALLALSFDLLLTVSLSLCIGIFNKRKDVFLYSPVYPLLRLVDCTVFLYSFWKIVMRRQKILTWFAVNRYEST